MRTTLTLDADVAKHLEREIRRTGKSLKVTVNEGLRRGLGLSGKLPKARRFVVEPHPFNLLESLGTAANLTTDAHLAALSIEHQAELHSTDADFQRFLGLRWVNPLG